MAYSIGEAIAQGVVMGMGEGYKGVVSRRREDELIKKEDERWQERFKQQRTAQMQDWEQQFKTQQQAQREAYKIQRADQLTDQQAQFKQQQTLENSRQSFQLQQVAAASAEARKTAIFNQNLKYIGDNVDKGAVFKEYATRDVSEIASRLALTAAKAAPTKLQQEVYRDTLKRLNGMSKQEMLGQAGLIPADLSPYLNDPMYKDAIPKGYIAGIQGPQADMEQVFKFTPPAPEAGADTTELPKDVRQKMQRETSYKDSLLSDPVFQTNPQFQFTDVNPSVLNIIDTNLKGGQISPEYTDQQGMMSTPMRDAVIRGLNNGQFTVYNGQLTTTTAALSRQLVTTATEEQNQQLAQQLMQPAGAPMAPTGAPTTALPEGMKVPEMLARRPVTTAEPQMAPEAVLPTEQPLPQTSAEIRQAKVEEQAATKGSKEIAKKVTDELVVLEDIDSLKERMSTLSNDARQVMESVAFDEGGITGDAMRVWRTKAQQDPAAKEAYEFMQYYQAMRNKYAHSQFGASQTAPEMQNLLKVTGEGGWKGGAERLMTGLDALYNTGRSTVKAGLQGHEEGSVQKFLETSPIAAKALEADPVYGTDLGKSKAGLQTSAMNAIQLMEPDTAGFVAGKVKALAATGDIEAIADTNRLLDMYNQGQVDDQMVVDWFTQLGVK